MAEAARRVFVAGATGAVGTVFLPRARALGLDVRPHVRPATATKHPLGTDPQAQIFDITDAPRLEAALAGVDAVVCLVGTMRSRFDQGDTYESSDFQPVVELVQAAAKVAPGAHLVLLSSLGAREGSGYLGAKWRAEEAARGSPLDWTILRPSMFDSRDTAAAPSDGRARRPPPLVGGTLRALGHVPGLKSFADDLRPISVDVLARAIARVVADRGPLRTVLTGRQLWPLGTTDVGEAR
jgi:uncharacterized protein YbjT (DUF2867 family)